MMKVLVAGASGVLGRPTVQELQRAGHDVVGLARSDDAATTISALGAEPVRGDVHDANAVTRAMSGVEAIVNLVGALPTGASPDRDAWATIDRTWRAGTENLVRAAVDTKVQVF